MKNAALINPPRSFKEAKVNVLKLPTWNRGPPDLADFMQLVVFVSYCLKQSMLVMYHTWFVHFYFCPPFWSKLRPGTSK